MASLGREQAEAAARALAELAPASLTVSPLRRTHETTEPFAKTFCLEPEIRAEVAEVFDPSLPPEERKAIIGPFMAGRWRERVIASLTELGTRGLKRRFPLTPRHRRAGHASDCRRPQVPRGG